MFSVMRSMIDRSSQEPLQALAGDFAYLSTEDEQSGQPDDDQLGEAEVVEPEQRRSHPLMVQPEHLIQEPEPAAPP